MGNFSFYSPNIMVALDIQDIFTCLLYDLIILKRVPDTSTSEDLISNYDLVVRSMVYLSLNIVNVHKEPILFIFIILKYMKHSVRTVLGNSTSSYGGDKWAVPL